MPSTYSPRVTIPSAAALSATSLLVLVLVITSSSSLLVLQVTAQPAPPTSSTATPTSSAPFSLPTGSLAQLDRAGRAPHCVRVPSSAVPFCQDVVADRWIALPSALGASGTLAQAAMLSMDTFARTAAANWTSVLDGLDCRVDNYERRFSVFRTCDDCVHAYRYWLCSSLFADCVPASQRIPGVDGTQVPAVNRTEPVESFRIAAMAYLASPAGTVNATLTVPDRLDKPLPSQSAVLNVAAPLLLAQPADEAAVNAARATLKEVVKADLAVDEYTTNPPCVSTCHHVIQSCPAAFQFSCPRDHRDAWKAALLADLPGQEDLRRKEYPDYNPLC